MIFTNAKIYTAEGVIENGWLAADVNGTITALGEGHPPESADQVWDCQGQQVLPGFIDIHIHGALGHDVMDATPEALAGIAQFCAQHGVTSFAPTTLTDTHEKLMQALANIQAVMDAPPTGADILGAHVEGPYLNVEKAGAQNPQHIRAASTAEVEDILSTGIIRLIDIAPEILENLTVLELCNAAGVPVSIAHSSANYEQAWQAIRLGIRHSTHTFNAQTGLHHRQPGIVGAVLSEPAVYAELIADLIHVHPAAIRVLWRCKQPDHLILITDAVRAAGMPEGDYQFDDRTVTLTGSTVTLPGGTLAGSALDMDTALRNFVETCGVSLADCWQVTSLNAAKALQVADRKGSLEIGKDADLVILDEALNVQATIVGGRVVYQA